MGAIISSLRDKKAYYIQQAKKLRLQAQELRTKADNYPEAKRLEDLADEAEKAAQDIDSQLKNIGNTE